MNILFRTVVGAHIWKMEHSGSDLDLFEVFQVPTLDLLAGTASTKSTFDAKKEANTDLARHELETVVQQLLRGNVNFTFGIMSPIVQQTSNVHIDLINLILNHPYKNLYHSIRGMAVHNYKLYEKEGKLENPKKVNGILRVLDLGTIYLLTGDLHFKPHTNGHRSEIEPAIARLDEAYEASTLEEKIPEDLLRGILVRARLEDLDNRGDSL
jgi:predicted nucleotidyltransferase